jgi:hypothetical protein
MDSRILIKAFERMGWSEIAKAIQQLGLEKMEPGSTKIIEICQKYIPEADFKKEFLRYLEIINIIIGEEIEKGSDLSISIAEQFLDFLDSDMFEDDSELDKMLEDFEKLYSKNMREFDDSDDSFED